MIQVDQALCIGCGQCQADCFSGAIRVREGKAQPPEGDCLLCGHCVAVCPVGAVSIPDYDMADVEPCGEGPAVEPEKLLRLIKERRSIRRFTERKIEEEKLRLLFEAGRYTATAKNNQDCLFILVQEQQAELERRVWDYVESMEPQWREDPLLRQFVYFLRRYRRDGREDTLFRNAPAVLFVCSKRPLDAGLAAQDIELMAAAQGLGAQYNGYLQRLVESSRELKDWLGTGDRTVAACMLLGYPAVRYWRTAPRKSAQVIEK